MKKAKSKEIDICPTIYMQNSGDSFFGQSDPEETEGAVSVVSSPDDNFCYGEERNIRPEYNL